MTEKRNLSASDKFWISILVTILGIVIGLFVPEVRHFLGIGIEKTSVEQKLPKLPKIVYIQSSSTAKTKAEKIKTLLLGLGVKVPAIQFMLSKYSINDEIRYFFDNDYLGVVEIQKMLSEQDIEATIKYMPELASKVKQGTIEVLLK